MVVVLAKQKGGVGATTAAVSLAVEAMGRGLRTLLVDADPQRTASVWGEVAAEQGRPAPTVVGMAGAMHRADQLPALAEGHDLVVVDLPPRLEAVTRSALMVADVVLLPSGGSAADVWALGDVVRLVDEARTLRPDLPVAVLLTRAQTNTAMGRAARSVLEESGLPVLRASLGFRVTYAEALAAGQGPTTYAPRSEAADEVRRLLTEVLALGGPPDASRKAPRRVPPTPKASPARRS
ncbi:MAG TPA: ParA family partition ATPase [Polyangiaceae bacterium]|nr:ParA family partition ATPase [Polyangiaceae bacterium]